MKVILLCAGFATRLYPLTLDKPKPLLTISEKPIIEHIIAKIELIRDIEEIVLVTNQKFFDNFNEWQKEFSCAMPIKIINDGTSSDEDKLGAVGDVDFAVRKENIGGDILVIAGDNLFDFDLKKLVDFFNEKNSSVIALYDVKEKELIKGRYGAVTLNDDNKVIEIEEKPEKPKTTLASTACYIFSKNDIGVLEECIEKHEKPDNLGDFIKLLAKKGNLYGLVFSGRWFDIGDKGQLKKANEEWSKK
jgi:glucose-1-phosphate thymidylyltransferase